MEMINKFEKAKNAYLKNVSISLKSGYTFESYSMILCLFGDWLEQNNEAEKLSIISPMHIVEWKAYLKEQRGISSNTIAQYLTVLKGFFVWANEHGFFDEQPVLKIDIPKHERIEYDLLTEQELRIILSGKLPSASVTKTTRRNRAMIFIFLLVGLRVSELVNLKVGDIDLKKDLIRVVGKGDKLRYSALPQRAKGFIEEYLNSRKLLERFNENDYLFPSDDGGALTRQNVTNVVKSYVKRLTGHDNISAHDLRHSACALMDNFGVSLRDVQMNMGHSSIHTTERIYLQVLNKSKSAISINEKMNMALGQ